MTDRRPPHNQLGTSENHEVYALPFECFEAFKRALAEESDRARIIVSACWIEEFLKVKLMNEFSKGNADARKSLFSVNGPFATFSAKVTSAYCAGWIDADVYHDINVIRKLRNICAHSIEPVSLDDQETRALIESLRVPHRQFYDWGELRAAAIPRGVVLYTREKPSADATEDLAIPGAATFKIALPLVVAVLVANLGIPFATAEERAAVTLELPEHMELDE